MYNVYLILELLSYICSIGTFILIAVGIILVGISYFRYQSTRNTLIKTLNKIDKWTQERGNENVNGN